MNTKIWKFLFEVVDFQTLNIPYGAKLLHIGTQQDIPTLWAAVNPEQPLENRRFWVVGTGGRIPRDSTYVGTSVGSEFVWHIYEDI